MAQANEEIFTFEPDEEQPRKKEETVKPSLIQPYSYYREDLSLKNASSSYASLPSLLQAQILACPPIPRIQATEEDSLYVEGGLMFGMDEDRTSKPASSRLEKEPDEADLEAVKDAQPSAIQQSMSLPIPTKPNLRFLNSVKAPASASSPLPKGAIEIRKPKTEDEMLLGSLPPPRSGKNGF